MSRATRLTSHEQFVPGMKVRLNHVVYGSDNYIVESLPWVPSEGPIDWLILLRHENSQVAVEHSLSELGVIKPSGAMWVDTPDMEVLNEDVN